MYSNVRDIVVSHHHKIVSIIREVVGGRAKLKVIIKEKIKIKIVTKRVENTI